MYLNEVVQSNEDITLITFELHSSGLPQHALASISYDYHVYGEYVQ